MVTREGYKELDTKTNFEKVLEFHKHFGAHINQPVEPGTQEYEDLCKLRDSLIQEEFDELRAAMVAGDRVEIADALADIAYVTYGCAIAFGINLDACVDEVHRSNMSKSGPDGPVRRHDGKILKGPNYFRPDLKAVLEKHNQPL